MTIGTWLNYARDKLENAGIGTARLDSQVLLADILQRDRSWLMAHLDTIVTDEAHAELDDQLNERAQHVPLAYIRGKTEFYGREFIVNEHTLEPRPETETMIDMLLDLVRSNAQQNINIADIGTGSGCIAATTKLEAPQLHVVATDIDEMCIKTAGENAKNLVADITLLKGNLIEPLNKTNVDIILSNLPYVPTKYKLNRAATFEPLQAIFGGSDGLDYYRELFAQLDARQQKPKQVLTESLPFQHLELAEIALKHSYFLQKTDDFIQQFVYQN